MARLPGPSLTEPYLKTVRAKVHLDALRNELNSFYQSKPYTLFPKENLKTGRYEVRIKMRDTPNMVPLILGDLLYCLRSALDQTIWQLAKLKSGGYPEDTQFPILDKWNHEARKTFKRQTAGVPAGAIGIIKALQPHHRANPSAHLLWRLHALNNIDKHRRIPVWGDMLAIDLPHARTDLLAVLTRDAEHHMFSAPLSFKSQMTLKPEIPMKVIFGDMAQGISCDFDGVETIYEFVADKVIPRFDRFFP